MEKYIDDWFRMVNAMVDDNFDHRKVIEGPSFRLHVIADETLEGIMVKSSEGVLFTIAFDVTPRFNKGFTKEVINSDDQRWLEGYSKEEKVKFLKELKHAFFLQVIKGMKGENVMFFCPDIPTLHKWAKVLNLKP